MKVILGPAAGEPSNYGSATTMKSIAKLMRPLHRRDDKKWVAGHLLNDNLGGYGSDSKNLTPLTKKANRRHATYEKKVKDFCIKARQFHDKRENREVAYWICVKYTVTVSTEAYRDEPVYRGAPAYIKIKASRVHINKSDKKETDKKRLWSATIMNEL